MLCAPSMMQIICTRIYVYRQTLRMEERWVSGPAVYLVYMIFTYRYTSFIYRFIYTFSSCIDAYNLRMMMKKKKTMLHDFVNIVE